MTNVRLSTVYLKAGGQVAIPVPVEHAIFFYVIKGKLAVKKQKAEALQLLEFNNDGEDLNLQASEDSLVLFGNAKPLGEPAVAQGPFVMNTQQEIAEAYSDYQQGKFDRWE